MFPNSDRARLFTLPPGVDFGAEVVRGLLDRTSYSDPAALMGAEVFVNTRRLQRRVTDLLQTGAPRVLPKIRLITDLARDPIYDDLPPAVAPLRRRLELTALVARLLEAEPDLAPKSSLFALSDSLASVMSEMFDEGVLPDALERLDVSDDSGHWARALNFLRIAVQFSKTAESGPDPAERSRSAVLAQIARWTLDPPQHPIVIAGTTASRGTTALLTQAVAGLPQGAVILPGFDTQMPKAIWGQLDTAMTGEDHPQFRFARLAQALDLDPAELPQWTSTPAPSADRNALVSLALRPAPVTDGWRAEAPNLKNVATATQNLTLIEAPSPRIEAEAIALRLRQAAFDGVTTALITPDRVLTRQVAAALSRWDLHPDDSAGMPLHLSPPGRLLRETAAFLAQIPTAQGVISLLKHPLTHSGEDRGDHLRWSRELELSIRRNGPPYPGRDDIMRWSQDRDESARWALWLAQLLDQVCPETAHLQDHVTRHIAFTEILAAGAETGSGGLWDAAAGRAALQIMTSLRDHADAGTHMTGADYAALLMSVLQGEDVHDRDAGHPHILIWGTLEARVQSADMVILAGLNEGSWPEMPGADPWLNRHMRAQAGLLLPDRRIGLAAHDFQQAIAAKEVWLTRSIRSEEAETVASRWVNRLTNLMAGFDAGRACLDQMRARGAQWIAMAQSLGRPSEPVLPAPRPSPRPPVAARPKRLRVTDISQLLRDPYAIYAREVLRLAPVNPLVMDADARVKGIAIHGILEQFVRDHDPMAPDAKQRLLELTDRVLQDNCPWPTARVLWRAQMARNVDAILADEIRRRADIDTVHVERMGEIAVNDIVLRGRADRIDVLRDGRAVIYDYKTGKPPTVDQQKTLDKQLLVEAAMVEQGAFQDVGSPKVARAEYLQIGAAVASVAAPLADHPPDRVWADLHALFGNWADPAQGYTARMAAQTRSFGTDFDHLSRYGEWDETVPPNPEDVG